MSDRQRGDQPRGTGSRPAEAIGLATIARQFYVRGKSKLEIAEEFGISRFKVARMLTSARDRGLVRVEFELPAPIDVDLSDEIRETFRLPRVLVLERAQQGGGRAEVRRRIGQLAAELLTEIVTTEDVLGLAWARTVNAMTEFLRELAPCPVVQLCGVRAGRDMRDRSVETVRRVAEISGGAAYPIFGPLVLPDRRTAETLRGQPGIAETFDQFGKLTKAVVSIGAWQQGESTVYDALDSAECAEISARGATGEVAARLFEASGRPLSAGLAHHVLGITAAELGRVPEVIALAHGAAKAEAIRAVLASGIVHTLVTDAAAAKALLMLAK
ncbi:DNA-binding transcriptional regulator LsrR (DeoR family) [Tamaricihabitans halophyticus]|uniref:DNA-binding transcriptional regulator LsrR (DeoR family) n=1 Tax=Tamaricihabitans halophyticus TaxID=1262583 RepID=A0A4R2R4S2_9PSEU|nr:sugar-binding domain-containing protein [Tamaricihabitans halophyticus]TCP56924.1 DNA-binding transcriptional regulator LsrR (DeoR family) [Tamaricihabitans halophyticus]